MTSAQRAALCMRIAGVIFLVHAVLHTVGLVLVDGSASAAHVAAVVAMRADSISVFGVSRTYLDFYRAFEAVVGVALMLLAAVSWQVGTLARIQPLLARPLVATLFIVMIPLSEVAWTRFYLVPGILASCETATLGLAAAFLFNILKA